MTVCNANQYQSTPPTATTDAGCSPLTQCSAGQYEAVAPTETTDRVCKACAPESKYVARALSHCDGSWAFCESA